MSIYFAIWFILVFVMGCCVGSFINVCVYRLPMEKSVFWPGSHCGNCFNPIRWYDNIPLFSYLALKGKCRACKLAYSIRYFFVELITGLLFGVLFWADIGANHFAIEFFSKKEWQISRGIIPWEAWVFFISHAALVSLLLTASLTDLDSMEIPLAITVWGTLLGLIFSAIQPWPAPGDIFYLNPKNGIENKWPFHPLLPMGGFPWPFWTPVPDSIISHGTIGYGLIQGIVGALVGTFLLRLVRFCYGVGRGIEVMGLGDADLMMMAGAFLGWQIVVTAFFLSVIPAFFMGVGQLIFRGSQAFPFGPSLALSCLGTLYAWPWLGPKLQPVFFEAEILSLMGIIIFVGLGILGIVFRFLMRGENKEMPPG